MYDDINRGWCFETLRSFYRSPFFSCVVLAILFAVVVKLLRLIVIDDLVPVYIAATIAVSLPFFLRRAIIWRSLRREEDIPQETIEAFQQAQQLISARRQMRDRVPKHAPRRDDSEAAEIGANKIAAARSMAALIRKHDLRDMVSDICDCAEIVVETIRRMPADTPASATFADEHLNKLIEAIDAFFSLSKQLGPNISRVEIRGGDIFAAFILAFRQQQTHIIFEGSKCGAR